MILMIELIHPLLSLGDFTLCGHHLPFLIGP